MLHAVEIIQICFQTIKINYVTYEPAGIQFDRVLDIFSECQIKISISAQRITDHI